MLSTEYHLSREQLAAVPNKDFVEFVEKDWLRRIDKNQSAHQLLIDYKRGASSHTYIQNCRYGEGLAKDYIDESNPEDEKEKQFEAFLKAILPNASEVEVKLLYQAYHQNLFNIVPFALNVCLEDKVEGGGWQFIDKICYQRECHVVKEGDNIFIKFIVKDLKVFHVDREVYQELPGYISVVFNLTEDGFDLFNFIASSSLLQDMMLQQGVFDNKLSEAEFIKILEEAQKRQQKQNAEIELKNNTWSIKDFFEMFSDKPSFANLQTELKNKIIDISNPSNAARLFDFNFVSKHLNGKNFENLDPRTRLLYLNLGSEQEAEAVLYSLAIHAYAALFNADGSLKEEVLDIIGSKAYDALKEKLNNDETQAKKAILDAYIFMQLQCFPDVEKAAWFNPAYENFVSNISFQAVQSRNQYLNPIAAKNFLEDLVLLDLDDTQQVEKFLEHLPKVLQNIVEPSVLNLLKEKERFRLLAKMLLPYSSPIHQIKLRELQKLDQSSTTTFELGLFSEAFNEQKNIILNIRNVVSKLQDYSDSTTDNEVFEIITRVRHLFSINGELEVPSECIAEYLANFIHDFETLASQINLVIERVKSEKIFSELEKEYLAWTKTLSALKQAMTLAKEIQCQREPDKSAESAVSKLQRATAAYAKHLDSYSTDYIEDYAQSSDLLKVKIDTVSSMSQVLHQEGKTSYAKRRDYQTIYSDPKTQKVLSARNDLFGSKYLKLAGHILTLGIVSKVRTGSFKFWQSCGQRLLTEVKEDMPLSNRDLTPIRAA